MRAVALWTALLGLGVALAQETGVIRRDGAFWVQSDTGRCNPDGAMRLRVLTTGDLHIRGENLAELRYQLHKRVRAPGEAGARELLEAVRVETERRGEWLEIAVRAPAGVSPSLRLDVPQEWREVRLVCRAGGVAAARLKAALRVENGGGPVAIEDLEGPLELRTGGGKVTLSRIRGRVRCVSGGGAIVADGVQGTAELITGGGEVTIRDASGPLRVRSGGGNIRVERAGSLSAATAGGAIEIAQAQGPVVAETAAGVIRVRAARGVRVNSGSGKIHLEEVAGPVHALTGLGDIVAAWRAAADFRDSELRSAAGDITVFIPSNIAVTVEATSGAERAAVVSDFAEIQARRRPGGIEARGALNGGGAVLRLAASEGSVYLRKADQRKGRTSGQP
ncbi:MAG: DUF4097 family beta strand repeat-containing protein [Bryobacteraceae bacterium]